MQLIGISIMKSALKNECDRVIGIQDFHYFAIESPHYFMHMLVCRKNGCNNVF
jgi:hypothetical protein